MGFSLISWTVTHLKRDEDGGGGYVLFSSPIALPLSGLGVYIFAADWPLIKDHTPSAGGLVREKEGREDWMRYGG